MSINTLAIRVDGAPNQGALLRFLSSDGGAYFVVSEEVSGENAHAHAVVHTSRKTPAFRMALKRALSLEGNGCYSVAEVRDLAKYCRYMCKGTSSEIGPVVIGAYGLQYADDGWQAGQHAAYWTENAALGRKRKLEPVYDTVLASCKEAAISWENREGIAKIYIRELASRDKPINIFSLKSNINLIQIKLCPTELAIEDLARQV